MFAPVNRARMPLASSHTSSTTFQQHTRRTAVVSASAAAVASSNAATETKPVITGVEIHCTSQPTTPWKAAWQSRDHRIVTFPAGYDVLIKRDGKAEPPHSIINIFDPVRRFPSKVVSKEHACITWRTGTDGVRKPYLLDLASTHGTKVERNAGTYDARKKRWSPASVRATYQVLQHRPLELKEGDCITLGKRVDSAGETFWPVVGFVHLRSLDPSFGGQDEDITFVGTKSASASGRFSLDPIDVDSLNETRHNDDSSVELSDPEQQQPEKKQEKQEKRGERPEKEEKYEEKKEEMAEEKAEGLATSSVAALLSRPSKTAALSPVAITDTKPAASATDALRAETVEKVTENPTRGDAAEPSMEKVRTTTQPTASADVQEAESLDATQTAEPSAISQGVEMQEQDQQKVGEDMEVDADEAEDQDENDSVCRCKICAISHAELTTATSAARKSRGGSSSDAGATSEQPDGDGKQNEMAEDEYDDPEGGYESESNVSEALSENDPVELVCRSDASFSKTDEEEEAEDDDVEEEEEDYDDEEEEEDYDDEEEEGEEMEGEMEEIEAILDNIERMEKFARQTRAAAEEEETMARIEEVEEGDFDGRSYISSIAEQSDEQYDDDGEEEDEEERHPDENGRGMDDANDERDEAKERQAAVVGADDRHNASAALTDSPLKVNNDVSVETRIEMATAMTQTDAQAAEPAVHAEAIRVEAHLAARDSDATSCEIQTEADKAIMAEQAMRIIATNDRVRDAAVAVEATANAIESTTKVVQAVAKANGLATSRAAIDSGDDDAAQARGAAPSVANNGSDASLSITGTSILPEEEVADTMVSATASSSGSIDIAEAPHKRRRTAEGAVPIHLAARPASSWGHSLKMMAYGAMAGSVGVMVGLVTVARNAQ